MKNYKIFSILAVVLVLALAGGAGSLIFGADVMASGQTATAKVVNANTACCGSSCASMTPEQCAAKMGADKETASKRMKECQKGTSTSCRYIKAGNTRCNPSDCPKYPDCKKSSHCKASKPCGGAASCKAASKCSSGNIDSSN